MNLKNLSVTHLEERASYIEEEQLKSYSEYRKLHLDNLMAELKRRQLKKNEK